MLHNLALLKCVRQSGLKDFSNQLCSALGDQELVIDSDFFAHPEQLPLVSEIKSAYAKWLESFVNQPIDAEKISSRFPAYFVDALHNEWSSRNDQYLVIKEILDTPFTQANKRQQQWSRYRAWLQKQIEEPMFAEAFSLNQVYVPLRAYYEKKCKLKENEKIERVAVKLNESLQSWLEKRAR
jgi:hypothetical protein